MHIFAKSHTYQVISVTHFCQVTLSRWLQLHIFCQVTLSSDISYIFLPLQVIHSKMKLLPIFAKTHIPADFNYIDFWLSCTLPLISIASYLWKKYRSTLFHIEVLWFWELFYVQLYTQVSEWTESSWRSVIRIFAKQLYNYEMIQFWESVQIIE